MTDDRGRRTDEETIKTAPGFARAASGLRSAQALDQLRGRIGIRRKADFHLREAHAPACREPELAVRLGGEETVAHELLLQVHDLRGAEHRNVGSSAPARRGAR